MLFTTSYLLKLSSIVDNLRRCQVDYVAEAQVYSKGTVIDIDEILDNDLFVFHIGTSPQDRAYTATRVACKNIGYHNLVISFFGSASIGDPGTVVFNIKTATNTIECAGVNGSASPYNYVTIVRYRF